MTDQERARRFKALVNTHDAAEAAITVKETPLVDEFNQQSSIIMDLIGVMKDGSEDRYNSLSDADKAKVDAARDRMAELSPQIDALNARARSLDAQLGADIEALNAQFNREWRANRKP